MSEECKKSKGWVQDTQVWRKILFSLQKWKLSVISKYVNTCTLACRGKEEWWNTESKFSHSDYCCSIQTSFMGWNESVNHSLVNTTLYKYDVKSCAHTSHESGHKSFFILLVPYVSLSSEFMEVLLKAASIQMCQKTPRSLR